MRSFVEFGTPGAFAGRRKAVLTDSCISSSPNPFTPTDDTPTGIMKSGRSPGSPSTVSFLRSGSLSAVISKIFVATFALSFLAFVLRPVDAQQTTGGSSTTFLKMEAKLNAMNSQVKALQNALQDVNVDVAKLSLKQKADHASLKQQLAGIRVSTASAISTAAKASVKADAAHQTVPAASSRDGFVRLEFIYDATDKLDDEMEIYWLSGNQTERLYATLPAGKRIEEITTPGQCWRARAKKSGQHVIAYCASSQAIQTIRIEPHADVKLLFHYPRAEGSALGVRASIYELNTVLGKTLESLVGHVSRGAHLSFTAKAGIKYTAREEISRRPLLDVPFTAGYEAEQHVDLAATHVTLVFQLAPTSPPNAAADVFWTWGDARDRTVFAREHRYGTLTAPGQMINVSSAPGEQWVVRQAGRPGEGAILPELLKTVMAFEAPPKQQHIITVPSIRD